MSQPSQVNYRPDIDGMRALAIIAVIAFHAFPTAFKGGYVGVDVFFVISGFLISSILFRASTTGSFSFIDFYLHRAKRLFPALFIVLLATIGLGWVYLLPSDFAALGKHAATSAAFTQNFLLWSEAGYFDVSADQKPLLHLWSLGIEEQFYLIYPFIVWVLWRRPNSVLPALIILATISFFLNVATVSKHPATAFFLPHTRFWELLSGAILAYTVTYRPNDVNRQHHWCNASSIVGILLIIVAVGLVNQSSTFPGWWALMPVTGAYLIIWAGPKAIINRAILSSTPMVLIGKISYPLYLWHWPLLSIAEIVSPGQRIRTRIGLLLLSTILAWLTYRYIERPIRFSSFKFRLVPHALIASVMSLGIIGLTIFYTGGVPSRLPSSVQILAAYNYDFKSDARVAQCWLNETHSTDGYADICYGNLLQKGEKPSIVLWGDSHAARLFPGVNTVWRDTISVAQLTRNSCPPLLGYQGVIPNRCEENNQYVASIFREHPGATVILFAVWPHYATSWDIESQAGQSLLRTIHTLERAGVKRIIVMGPAPKWVTHLPKLILTEIQKDFRQSQVPIRMNTHLDPSPKASEQEIKSLIASTSAEYFSVLDALCTTPDGCLVRTNANETSFTTWDYGHLTTAGAEVVAAQLALTPSKDAITYSAILNK